MKSRFFLLLMILTVPFLLQAKILEKVSVQLQWLHAFQFAGYYIAKERGFYEEVGLDVEIKPFESGIIPVDEVLGNRATYGIGRSSLIIDRSNGRNIVLLSALFQSSPLMLLATKESNITTIQDFVGKRVMLTDDGSETVALQAMLNRNGIALDDMVQQKHSMNIGDLISKKTDLMSSYLSDQPFQLKERGVAYKIFDPKEYGFDFYNDLLFTSEEEITQHKQRAVAFTTASLRGWEYAFSHIDETVALILEKYNVQNRSKEALIFEASASKNLAYYKTEDLGHIDPLKIERIYDFYNVMGLLENSIDLDAFVQYEHQHKNFKNFSGLTRNEKVYLENKKEIRVCVDPDWMPFEQIQDGKLVGMSAEYLRIIESRVQTPLTLVPTKNWSESLAYAKERRCDIISLAMETPERKKYMNFTRPYLNIPLVIATTADKHFIAGIDEVLDKRLGIVKGYAFAELLRLQYPSINLVEVDTLEQGLSEVANGALFGFLDNLTTISYQMQKNYIGTLKIAGRLDQKWELGIGVRNDDMTLLSILDKALRTIDYKTRQGILNQWMSVRYEQGIDHRLFWQILGAIGLISVFMTYWFYIVRRHNRDLKKLNQKLEKLSTTDALTKLYNRRYLDKNIDKAFGLAERHEAPFSLILMDIDNFKMINDTYGHSKGDIVLERVANIIDTHSRKNDIVGRWGGEEFLIICSHSKLEGALNVAEKMCREIEKEVSVGETPVTASFGVTEYCYGDTNDSIMTRVDKALYRAKDEGKNRVVIAQ